VKISIVSDTLLIALVYPRAVADKSLSVCFGSSIMREFLPNNFVLRLDHTTLVFLQLKDGITKTPL